MPRAVAVAPLTDAEAYHLAAEYVDRNHLDWVGPGWSDHHDWGYTFYFESPFDDGRVPPKSAHVLAVHHNGTVNEWRPLQRERY